MLGHLAVSNSHFLSEEISVVPGWVLEFRGRVNLFLTNESTNKSQIFRGGVLASGVKSPGYTQNSILSSRWLIHDDKKVGTLLIQPGSSQVGPMRGEVVSLEYSITIMISGSHK